MQVTTLILSVIVSLTLVVQSVYGRERKPENLRREEMVGECYNHYYAFEVDGSEKSIYHRIHRQLANVIQKPQLFSLATVVNHIEVYNQMMKEKLTDVDSAARAVLIFYYCSKAYPEGDETGKTLKFLPVFNDEKLIEAVKKKLKDNKAAIQWYNLVISGRFKPIE